MNKNSHWQQDTFLDYFEKTYKDKIQSQNINFADRYNGFHLMFKELLQKKQGPFTIIETGTLRKKANWMDGQSSLLFYDFLTKFGGKFISLDLNPNALKECESILAETFPNSNNVDLKLLTGDSVEILAKINEPVDLIYLDSYDLDYNNPAPSMFHHLKELINLKKIIQKSQNLIIAVDDNPLNNRSIGKGKLVLDCAKETNQKILYDGFQIIFQIIY
jgi:hypothetical protein